MATDGPHAGDMPNLHIPADGNLAIEVVNAAVTLDKDKPNSLFKPEGHRADHSCRQGRL